MKKLSLKGTKVLMVASYLLLVIFTGLWLQSQLKNEKDQLTKGLAKLFTNVQEQIADSLMLVKYVYPAMETNVPAAADINNPSETTAPTHIPDPAMMQGMRILLKNAPKMSKAEEKQLFRMDTIVFNEIFTGKMKENGWNFDAKWIPSQEKNTMNSDTRIFLQSHFFTNENGVSISRFDGYLFRRMLPQFGFVLILLSITGLAFWSMYRSLKEQMKLGRMKNDFVSNMSHELKTPISTVKVALEALHHFDVIQQPEISREYLEMAMHEMERLELLVGKALHTSLLESGRLVIQPELYDLEKLVTQVVQAYQIKLLQHEASISVHTIGDNFLAEIDPLHTQGVLVNLLDNSIKYGNGAVRITIILREQDDSIQLAVSDNGPGIPEEYREKVFEKFFRIPTGNKHNTKGYGLGLSYAAQVMAQQKGNIAVQNVPEGGCVFTLTF